LRKCLCVVNLSCFEPKEGRKDKYHTNRAPVEDWCISFPIINAILLL
jgi:hypothetical protein